MYQEHVLGNPATYPTWLTLLQLAVMINMFAMFMQYFAKRYCCAKSRKNKSDERTDPKAKD